MKKKIKFMLSVVLVLALAALSIGLLGACADMSTPNPISEEIFRNAAETQGVDVEEEDDGLVAELAAGTYVWFFAFEAASETRAKFSLIDDSYAIRNNSVSVDMGHNMRRFTSQGMFVRIYRIQHHVLYAYGPIDQRSVIDDFVNLVVTR